MLKAITVALPDEGTDKFVEIRDPKFLRWKEQKQLSKQDGESDIDYSVRLLKFLVIGGNISAEDGRQLNYPLDDSDIDEFTNYVVAEVMTAYKDASEAMTASKN